MITLRLEPEIESAINSTAKILGLTKSELIRQSINEYLAKVKRQNPWEAGEELFGKYSSGYGNLSLERKALLRNKIKAKRE